MKRLLLISISLLLMAPAFSQNTFRGGLRLGISTSQVEGDGYRGFNKFGLEAGPTLNAKFNDKWSSQFEILFIQKGSRHSKAPDSTGYLYDTYYEMALNYVEVPILLNYKQKKFTFGAGLGFGYLISAHEYNAYGEIPPASPFIRSEFSCIADLNYQVFKKLGLTWRYSNSILPIRKYASGASFWFNPGQVNVVLALTLTYKFGEVEGE